MSMTFGAEVIISSGQQLKLNKIAVPTSSGGTDYGNGTSGQVIKSDGTNIYWASDSNSDTKVQQSAVITTNGAYSVLHAYNTGTAKATNVCYKSAMTYNPSTKALVTGGTVNGLTLTAATTGFTIAGGTTSKTLTVGNSYTLGEACEKSLTDIKTLCCFKVTITNISSLPVTKTVSGCTTAHEVISSSLSNPNAQSGDWTIDTGTAGKITISGTVVSGESTTLTLFMGVPQSVSGT